MLTLIHGHLLRAARLVEGNTANWLSPTRKLEQDVSPAAHERFKACTATLDAARLVRAYQSTWEWGRELMAQLSGRRALALPAALLEKVDRRVAGIRP